MDMLEDKKSMILLKVMDDVYHNKFKGSLIIKSNMYPLFFILFNQYVNKKYSNYLISSIGDFTKHCYLKSNDYLSVTIKNNKMFECSSIIGASKEDIYKSNFVADEKDIRKCLRKVMKL